MIWNLRKRTERRPSSSSPCKKMKWFGSHQPSTYNATETFHIRCEHGMIWGTVVEAYKNKNERNMQLSIWYIFRMLQFRVGTLTLYHTYTLESTLLIFQVLVAIYSIKDGRRAYKSSIERPFSVCFAFAFAYTHTQHMKRPRRNIQITNRKRNGSKRTFFLSFFFSLVYTVWAKSMEILKKSLFFLPFNDGNIRLIWMFWAESVRLFSISWNLKKKKKKRRQLGGGISLKFFSKCFCYNFYSISRSNSNFHRWRRIAPIFWLKTPESLAWRFNLFTFFPILQSMMHSTWFSHSPETFGKNLN